MLNFNQRLLYTDMLRPPEGYVLEKAFCSSYSIDLNMIIAACISLNLSRESNYKNLTERLDALAAIHDITNKLRIYYQAGQIKLPKIYNRIYTLIEPFAVQIKPEKGSFHPKVWVIKYKKYNENEYLFRLIVQSRNLTDSKQWDISLFTDGKISKDNNLNQPLVQFVQEIINTNGDSDFFKSMLDELSQVKFEQGGFDTMTFLSMPKSNILFDSINPEKQIIISPFLSQTQLNKLPNVAKENSILISREDSLNKINKETLDKFTCCVLNPKVIDGQRFISDFNEDDPEPIELHAKIYAFLEGENKTYYLGSANCTEAAFSDNTEAMIKLSSKKDIFSFENTINIDNLRENKFLVDYNYKETPDESVEGLKSFVKTLRDLNFEAVAESVNNHYNMILKLYDLEIPENMSVFVRPISINEFKPFEKTITFDSAGIDKLTSYFIFEIRDTKDKVLERLILFAEIQGVDFEIRKNNVFKHIFTSGESLMKYIYFLIDHEHPVDGENNSTQSNVTKDDSSGIITGLPIYEKMLEAAANNSEQLRKIDEVIIQAEKNEHIPEDLKIQLKQFWEPFRQYIR